MIDAAGLVLTEYGVLRITQSGGAAQVGAARYLVTDTRGEDYIARIRAADPRSGLALLAIESKLSAQGRAGGSVQMTALPIGEAERLRKGRFVVAIGNPFSIQSDGQATASLGTVTNTAMKAPLNESLGGDRIDGAFKETLHHFGSLIQTDARLGWSASGGALVSLDGRLVGVTTTASAIAGHEQPAGYAIPMNGPMRDAIATMKRGLEPEYGLLGVKFEPSRSLITGRSGVKVLTAFRGGPADRAGVRANDLLLRADSQELVTSEALQLAVGSRKPGSQIRIAYERNGEAGEAVVTLGKAYIEGGQIVSARRPSWRGMTIDFATAIPPDQLTAKAAQGHIDRQGCVVVADVDQGSVSWQSGVRPYAFISHVSGKRVDSPDAFYAAVREAKDNVKLKFTKPLPSNNAAPVNDPA